MASYLKKQAKAKKYQDQLIDKAIDTLRAAMDRISDAREHGIEVTTYFDPVETLEKLESYKNGTSKRKPNLAYLKEAARPTYYDKIIKYDLPYTEQRGSFTVTSTKTLSQYEINRIKNKDARGGDLTSTETSYLMAWSEATSTANNYHNVPIIQTDAQMQEFIKNSRKKSLDLSFGGMSSLINDLTYSQDIEVAKDFITWLRDVMKDPQIFASVEKWYNTTNEGKKARYTINLAKGKNWYKNYKKFAESVVEMIDMLDNTFNLQAPSVLREKAEAIASESDI